MKSIEKRIISFIGGGIITGVFVERMINSGLHSPDNIMVSDIKKERLEELEKKYCVKVTQNNAVASEFGDFVFIAVPPPQVKAVLSEDCKMLRTDQVLISLAAAVPLWIYESVLCKEIAVVRVIANTPSIIGKGVNPYCLGIYLTEQQKKDVKELLSIFGTAVKIDESQMNIATAITAVGPTYWFPAVKSLLDFAKEKGIDKELSYQFVVGTLLGTAEMILQTMQDPDELKLMIGTRTINEQSVNQLFKDAVEEAFKKINYATEKLTQ